MNGFSFNARNFDPTQGVPGLPVSDSNGHPVVITGAELKPTRNNDGMFLEFMLSIFDGPAKGQSGAYRLNIVNNSKEAVDIAYKQLSAICHVTGVFDLNGPDPATAARALFNIPFRVVVGTQKNNPEYTEVKFITDINGNKPGGQPAAAAAPVAMPGTMPAGQPAPAGNWAQPAPAAIQPAPSAGMPGTPSPTPWAQPGPPAAQPAAPAQPAANWQPGTGVTPGAAPWNR